MIKLSGIAKIFKGMTPLGAATVAGSALSILTSVVGSSMNIGYNSKISKDVLYASKKRVDTYFNQQGEQMNH
jgi:hypothetical protein